MYTDFSETAYLGARPAAAVAPQAAPPQTGSQPAPAAAVQPAAAPAANWQLSRSINARGECMALSPDGTYLAAGYTTVGIWNVETGEKSSFRGTIPPNEDRNSIVRSLAFSPDGKFVAFGGGNGAFAVKPGSMGVWNIETKRELWILNAGASIFSVSFSPDGRYIASASGDGTVKLWDAATGRNVKTIGSHSSGWAMSAAFSPDGRYIVSGSERGDIKIWNTETSREIAALKHSGRIYSAVFSPNGKFIVSGGGDTIKIWDAHLFKEIRTIDPKRSSIRAAAISPDCRRIAAAFDITDRIAVYDVETGGELWVSDRASHGAESVVFDPGGNRIFSSWWNGGISIWKNE
jgi:WD40 repeat protein